MKIPENKPDIVILTSLLINDSGKASARDSANVPVLIKAHIHGILPDTVVMIEPPNPVTYFVAIK